MISTQLFAPSEFRLCQLQSRVVANNSSLICSLIEEWHSTLEPPQGWRVAFALTDGLTIYGVSTWGRPVARNENQETTLQHTRMALAPFAPFNSGSRFLKLNRGWIRANLKEVNRLIAYVDERYHRGIVYRADNWHIVYEHHPNNSNWMNRANRSSRGCETRTKFERLP